MESPKDTLTMKKKTIECRLSITSNISNYDLCQFVESLLQGSTLNNSMFNLEILETKVTKEEEIK